MVKQADIFSDKPIHGIFPIPDKVDGAYSFQVNKFILSSPFKCKVSNINRCTNRTLYNTMSKIKQLTNKFIRCRCPKASKTLLRTEIIHTISKRNFRGLLAQIKYLIILFCCHCQFLLVKFLYC